MGMISAQIDELRKWADQLSERENEFGVVVRAPVAALRRAANTIWQLRDDLQWANAENAKLRELAADMHRGIYIAYLRGRPLDPYQYESRMHDLGVEVE